MWIVIDFNVCFKTRISSAVISCHISIRITGFRSYSMKQTYTGISEVLTTFEPLYVAPTSSWTVDISNTYSWNRCLSLSDAKKRWAKNSIRAIHIVTWCKDGRPDGGQHTQVSLNLEPLFQNPVSAPGHLMHYELWACYIFETHYLSIKKAYLLHVLNSTPRFQR